jgi:hypothetical protein
MSRIGRKVTPTKRDSHHICEISIMAKLLGLEDGSTILQVCPTAPLAAVGGAFFFVGPTVVSDRVSVRLSEVSEAPPSPAYCSVCPTAKCYG